MNELISKISLKFFFLMAFLLLKTFASFFLMCRQLQRYEIDLIPKVSIKFESFFLSQNFA